MFPPAGASGHGVVDGIGGAVLVPTRFAWRYGGRRVFLTGSFTGWLNHIPMTPVEGCPTVFQAICNLTPGCHQYKFFVDGEWRHDEHQPSVIVANYGTVNTVLLSAEPDHTLHLDTYSHGTSMEVDNVGPLHMGTSLRISEDEMAASRHRIALFLSTKMAYDLLPESGKVTAIDVNLPVKQAFHLLYEEGNSVAPLWDSSKGKFVGMLSALDFILILRELGNHGSNLTKEELETHTISAWKEEKLRLKLDGHGRPPPRNLIFAGPHDTLKDTALKILHNEVATVPIIQASEDGSYHQLLHIACLSEILKCICEHFQHSSNLLPILQQPIRAFPMGTYLPRIDESNGKPLAMLSQHASLSAALSLLVQARVSCIPVVDDNNSLVDIYSRSDITALARDRAYAQTHLDQMSIHQALQLSQDAGSPSFNGQRCQMCLQTDPLVKVMDRLSKPGVRRVVIVEAGSKQVEGIISLSDVFKFFLG